METIAQKLGKVINSKYDIKDSIENYDVEVGNAPLAQYPHKIDMIIETIPLQDKTVEYVENETIEISPDEEYLGLTKVTITPPVVPANYLTFTNVDGDISTISMQKVGEAPDVNVEYSLDNGLNWNEFVVGETTISLDVDESVKFRGFNSNFATSTTDYNNFVMTGRISASGDITSLLNGEGGDVNLQGYVFARLFMDCVSLVKSPYMPSTNVPIYGYFCMYRYCANLIETQSILPALNVGEHAYNHMYEGTGLVIPPELPAKYLSTNSYRLMFYECNALSRLPDLNNIPLDYSCYQMFNSCNSLINVINVPTKKISGVYAFYAMFYNCLNVESIVFDNLEIISGDYTLYCLCGKPSSGTGKLKRIEFPVLKTIDGSYCMANLGYYQKEFRYLNLSALESVTGEHVFMYMFQQGPTTGKITVDLSSLRQDTLDACFRNAFMYSSTEVAYVTDIKIHPNSLRSNTAYYNPIQYCSRLVNVELTADASTNLYFQWQGLLSFDSVKNILEHCDNDNMGEGKGIYFYTSGLTITDDAQGTLTNLKNSIEARGCMIYNLTITNP